MRDVTDRDFDYVVEQAGLPVLVEFWKPGCGSCRALMRELEKLEFDVTSRFQRNWSFAHCRCWPSIARESSSGLSADWGSERRFSSSCG
jgi:hypothetical protein